MSEQVARWVEAESAESWAAITRHAETLSVAALEALDAALSHWPDALRIAPLHWVCPDPLPALRIARVLRTEHSRIGYHSLFLRDAGLIRLLDSGLLAGLSTLDLSSMGLTDAGAVALAGASLPRLAVLTLGHNRIGDEGLSALSRAGFAPQLTRLDLSRSALTDAGLAGLLGRLPRLTDLDLSDIPLTAGGIEVLASAGAGSLRRLALERADLGGAARCLTALPALTALTVRWSGLTADDMSHLAVLTGLQQLHLAGSPLDAAGVATLLRHAAPTLTDLDLGRTGCGDAGAEALAASARPLTSLTLNSNNITPAGATALAGMGTLRRLILSDNPLGDDGATAILTSPALTALGDLGLGHCGVHTLPAAITLPALRSLRLSYNRLGPEAAGPLSSLAGHLRALSVDDNPLTDAGVAALSPALLAGLRDLNLRRTDIGDAGVAAVAGVRGRLALGMNHIGSVGAATLAAKGTGLTELELGFNQIGPEGVEALAASPVVRALIQWTDVRLSSNPIGRRGRLALACSPHLPPGIRGNALAEGCTDAELTALAEHPSLATLSFLRLSHSHVSDAGIAALAASPYAGGLRILDLYANQLTAEGAATIANAASLQNLEILDLTGNRFALDGWCVLACSRLHPDIRADFQKQALGWLTMKQLKALARRQGLRGYSKMKRDTLTPWLAPQIDWDRETPALLMG